MYQSALCLAGWWNCHNHNNHTPYSQPDGRLLWRESPGESCKYRLSHLLAMLALGGITYAISRLEMH